MNDFATAVQTLADLIAKVSLVAVVLAVAMLLVGLPVVTFAVAFAAKKGGRLADVPLVKTNRVVCRWVADCIVVAAAMMRHRGYAWTTRRASTRIVQGLTFAKSSGKTSIERSRIVRAEATGTVVVSRRATGTVYTRRRHGRGACHV